MDPVDRITDRRQLPIIFDTFNYARRSEFKHLPSESTRTWRTPAVTYGPAYAVPPAPHDSYADFVAGRASTTWLAEDVHRAAQFDRYFAEPKAAPRSAPESARARVEAALRAREARAPA